MLKHWKIAVAVLAAFVVGQLDPAGFVFWKLEEWKLPGTRAESLAHPTPFESIPTSQWIGETENVIAFNDIRHDVPVHILVIPKKRYDTVLDAPPEVVAEMVGLAVKLARERHIDQTGFRLVINTNPQGAQTVYHLHMHLLGGEQLRSYE